MPSSPRMIGDPSSDLDDDVVILGRDDVSDFNEYNILPQPADIQKKIRKWLGPTRYDDPGSEYKKHSFSHLAGTGNWLLSSETYNKWHSSEEDGLLWIRGIPGSGKSVFAATLINQLKQEHHPVLYFFFRQIIDANHSAAAALRDWLEQIRLFSPPLQLRIKQYIDQSRSIETLSAADLWDLLRYALSHLPKAYIVVDALDEMNQNQDLEPFLQSLTELGEWRPSRVKVIMTSRPIAYIERCLRAAKVLNIRLEERLVDIDIAAYVRHRLEGSRIPEETRVLIEAAVPGRANGLFLFAKLALDAVLQPDTNVETIIEQLPKDLNNIYIDLLRDHSSRSGISYDIQLLILQAVTHATRPLRLLELAEMLNTINHLEYGQEKRDLKVMKNLVRSACGPLLEILPDETVSVVHHSFTEFLNGSTRQSDSEYPILGSGPTHNRLALICLSYLTSCSHDPQYNHVFNEYHSDILRLLPPFTQYASRNWYIHVEKSALAGYDQAETHRTLDEFLEEETMKKWKKMSGLTANTPLLAAAMLGLTQYMKHLLDSRGLAILKGDKYERPLCYAAGKGYEGIVEMLLKAGADPNEKYDTGETALIIATRHNHPKVIAMLIDAGVDAFEPIRYWVYHDGGRMCWQEKFCESPFELASRYGQVEAMATFFPHIKTPEQVSGALFQAVSVRTLPIVKMLLGHPLIDVNIKSGNHTPLFRACDFARADIIDLLVQAGADPNILNDCTPRDDTQRNQSTKKRPKVWNAALYNLVEQNTNNFVKGANYPEWLENKTRCIESLLAAGADVNQRNKEGNTALHKADDASIARTLLKAGADPNAENDEQQTPLHLCKNLDLLAVLLEDPRTKLESRNKRGETPLLLQLQWRRTDIALRLLEVGADGTVVDNCGDGAFIHALSILINWKGLSKGLHKRLDELGASLNRRNKNGETVMHVMMRIYSSDEAEFFEDVFSYFLSIGGDLEARDNNGHTPLSTFVENFDFPEGEERIKLLFKAGVRLDSLDFAGRNLYHTSLRNTHSWIKPERFFEIFSSCNIDLKQTDFNGNTILHEACTMAGAIDWEELPCQPSDMLEFLKDVGFDLSQPNNMGRTPIHNLCIFRAYRPEKPDKFIGDPQFSLLDHLLREQTIDIDQADNGGITALHLASTCCELNTATLLAAGANISKATYEGLTALHLAARSRQANILGLLLETLKSQTTAEEFLTIVNAKDSSPISATALYYACLSGHPVTVKLLLEAGATVDTPTSTGSPWLACADFEEEEMNWRLPKEEPAEGDTTTSNEFTYETIHDARGVTLKDKTRSRLFENTKLPARLDEILELLVQYCPSSVKYIDDAIAAAASNGFDYTVDCLVSRREAVVIENPLKPCFKTNLCLVKREAQRRAFEGHPSFEKSSKGLKSEFDLLMSLREYNRVTEILQSTDFAESDMDKFKSSILHELAAGGFTFILRKVLTKSLLAKLDDWETKLQEQEESSRGGDKPKLPLLLEVCKSVISNIEMIRFLVEELGVDVNTRYKKMFSCGYLEHEYKECDSAIHHLVTGNRWWQTAQALPYLVQRGANIEFKEESGDSPLSAALNQIKLNYLSNHRAIKLLLSYGADPNSVNKKGETCIAKSGYNIEIFKLILQSGVDITPPVLLTAIKRNRYDVLEALLSNGANPNMRFANKQKKDNHHIIDSDEMYPLHYAVRQLNFSSDTERESVTKIIRLLLDHGADPCAKYPFTTVMHNIIWSSDVVPMFIDHPSRDLEARDSAGDTLLFEACIRSARFGDTKEGENVALSIIEMLVDRGADTRARNNSGETVFHLLFNRNSREFCSQAFHFLLSKAPDLIDAPDNDGETPLHLAFKRMDGFYDENPHVAVDLFLAAGASPHVPLPSGQTIVHKLLQGKWVINYEGHFESDKRRIFEQIVEKGVEVNARDKKGETPLFGFFRTGEVSQIVPHDPTRGDYMAPDRFADKMRATINESQALEMFDRAGMDWKAVNNNRETLLHVVASEPNLSSWPGRATKRFKFLLDKGVDVTLEDSEHRTALDIAANRDAKGILDLFSRDPQATIDELVIQEVGKPIDLSEFKH